MNQYASMIRQLKSPEVMAQLNTLYGSREGMLVEQTARYQRMLLQHEELFHAEKPVRLISSPGRTEIGGNHTDHNRGRVLAAAVNLDMLAAVSARDDLIVNLHSEGYNPISVDLSSLAPREEERETTAALIRGVAARMAELHYPIGGCDVVMTSNVASGSGLSSSAALEVLMCAILDNLYGQGNMDAKTRAKISQYAENVYFGKPCGLLDQMASSVGGLVTVDFREDDPEVIPMQYDFAAKGYALVVVSTGGSHVDLTDQYAAIPKEMKEVANFFGEPYLRRVRQEEFFAAVPGLRGKVSDRALLRAMHFFQENKRVEQEVQALRDDRLDDFMEGIKASGRSSYMYLQNVYPDPSEQGLSLALCIAETVLGEDGGAWRVHGGGFAGTTLNFVPDHRLERFIEVMESTFGRRCCHVLDIRPVGPAVIEC